ncbi:MAG: pyridoxine 5'-phosphate synthase [Candidatus Omnitrophica bacterium]|nr:pyridoxine 5'-phosphate synthase [Candidatus Omnitrophota bacterium]
MIRLGVNIDHVATVRQARGAVEPDPVAAAVVAELGGADGITVHLREDRRHINDRDVALLRQTVRTRLNLEMSAAKEIVAIAGRIKPDQATLVPERRRELTTEGGLNVSGNLPQLKAVVAGLQRKSVAVSLFIDPREEQVAAAAKTGAAAVELHTGAYARAPAGDEPRQLSQLAAAAAQAHSLGLRVYAGHGLNYRNVAGLLQAAPEVEELNIGHAIVSRALFVGLETAVRQMRECMVMARKRT